MIFESKARGKNEGEKRAKKRYRLLFQFSTPNRRLDPRGFLLPTLSLVRN